jgi:two-component system sensor histidine kinase/response regulator
VVGVQSVPGVGSSFWLTLELGLPPPGLPQAIDVIAPIDAEPRHLAGARILVVEDNEINQLVARHLLQHRGCIVDVAGNGQIALDRLAAGTYDLVLMDVQMPVMDGISATIAIRAQPALRELPILAFTANATPQDCKRCLDAGMNDFLAKPVDARALAALLSRWIASPPAWPAPLSPPANSAFAAESR